MAPSLGTIVQYAFIAGISYVLLGSPLLQMLSSNSRTGQSIFDASAPEVPISTEKFESLIIPDPNLTCPEHSYSVHIFSRDPLVVYIENFVTDEEAAHLIEISNPLFQPSTTFHNNQPQLDPSVRLSEKARPPRTPAVRCVEARARAFQGFRPHVFVERLWTQRYRPGGHYAHHYDWAAASPAAGRVSSFMVYLEANCTGGGTNFPRLSRPGGGREWCRFLECEDGGSDDDGNGDGGDGGGDVEEGVTWKAIKGNAIYWENFGPDGRGYEESWHAGMPVKSGVKVGLNIWSWYQKGFRPPDVETVDSEGTKEEEK